MSRSFLLSFALMSIVSALPWPAPIETQSATSTANWTPAPTSNPDEDISFLELLRRDVYPVSVCGWIGGNVAQPAYCSTQSSCVWNSDYSIVGCCATASSNCEFYTSCIDMNSPQQVGDDADVYTCRGTSVCYSNTYPGNYVQWGCGSSDWATNIATSYSGMADGISLQIVTTGAVPPNSAAVTSTATPAATSQGTTSSSLKSQITSQTNSQLPATTSGTSSSTSLDTTAAVASSAAISNSSASSSTTSSAPIGAIVGGVVGGVAVIALIVVFCILGRRRGWFSKISKRGNLQNSSNSSIVQVMAQVPADHTSEIAISKSHSNGTAALPMGAPANEPKYDKKGVLITEPLKTPRAGPAVSKKTPKSGAKVNSKPKQVHVELE